VRIISTLALLRSLSRSCGGGWGGGKPHTLPPEVQANKSAVPEWRPHPALPREVRERERSSVALPT